MKNLFHKMTSLHLQKMGSGMRIAALVVFCLTLTAPLFANHSNYSKRSTVTIESWDGRPFIIEIGSKRYESDGVFTLRNINPGKKRIRVFRNSHGHHNSFNGHRRGRGSVLYNGFVDVPRNSRVRAKVTPNRRLRVIDVRRIGHGQSRPHHGTRPQVVRPNQGSCGVIGYQTIESVHYEDSHGFEPYAVEEVGHYGGACAMSLNQFDEMLFDIEDACFSSDKIRVVRQALRHNLITVNQLEQVLCRFDFDSDRLSVAKLAYDNVIDKENTWRLYDAFSFSSTADEFEAFVSSCG